MDAAARVALAQRQLAARMVPQKRQMVEAPQPITRRLGVVTAVNWTTMEADVLLNDQTLSGLKWYRAYTPRINDEVWLEFSGGQDPVIVSDLSVGLPALESWNVVGATGQPAFANAWVNYDTTDAWSKAAFKRDGDVLSVRGLIMDGTYAGVGGAFILPVGYRPRQNRFFATIGFAGSGSPTVGSIALSSLGEVMPYSGASQAGAGSWFSIELCTIL